MRTIEFRGKSIATGEWLYGDLVHRDEVYIFPENGTDSPDRYEVIHDTIGQFTGLHDCKGREIYEGDIVLIPKFGNCLVMWSGYGWGFHTVEQEVYPDGSMQYRPIGDYRFIFGQAVLVGNIHDNPDLMKRSEQQSTHQ